MASLTAIKSAAIDVVGTLVTGTAVGTVTGTGTNLITVSEDLSAALIVGDKIVVKTGTGLGEVYTVVTAVYDTDHTDITVTETIGSVIATDTIDKTVALGNGDDVEINGMTCTASSELTIANLTDTVGTGTLTTSADIEITTKCDMVTGLTFTGGAICTFSGAGAYNNNTIYGDCVFSGTGSYNNGGVTGDCTFSGDTSYNAFKIFGDCVFSGSGSYSNSSGDISGDCEFSGNNSYNDGDITGDCVFSGNSTTNAASGTITGNAEFSGTFASHAGTVSGNCTLSGDYSSLVSGNSVGGYIYLANMTATTNGYAGLNAVKIAPQADLVGEKILAGATILGVPGEASTTATFQSIINGQTARIVEGTNLGSLGNPIGTLAVSDILNTGTGTGIGTFNDTTDDAAAVAAAEVMTNARGTFKTL